MSLTYGYGSCDGVVWHGVFEQLLVHILSLPVHSIKIKSQNS